MKIIVAVYPGASLWGIGGVLEIFDIANQICLRTKRQKLFDVKLASTDAKQVITQNGLKLEVHSTFKDIGKPDLVIVPGTNLELPKILKNNNELISFIDEKYNKGSMVASFCTGTFLVAASGILANKSASTHWRRVELFRELFPDVVLKDEKIIIDEGDIFLGGGASSFHNLMIYLVEKFAGKEVAIATAKILLIDINKDLQSSYVIFSLQKSHKDSGIQKLQEHIEENYSKKYTIESLAKKVTVSPRTFMRRFKKATGDTPLLYVQRVKVEAAKKLLETTDCTFEEIVRKVGYEDISTFRQLFKKISGLSPMEYRKKYIFNLPA